ncbi:hypothetical protein [Pseudomonas fluorescens]|uniref:Uncharacterized protein n=1 Tax=Pseudomonas fluorescens TaxID=294 RepID=A0A5E7UX37_PSEFL|nr:hypothetical protein [Pseudomonas fluorescens]VVQ16107.1 hypothetical protein PS928_04339 [Pseudomonas fluorescens]
MIEYRGFHIDVTLIKGCDYRAFATRAKDQKMVAVGSGGSATTALTSARGAVDSLFSGLKKRRKARSTTRHRRAIAVDKVMAGEWNFSVLKEYGLDLSAAQKEYVVRRVIDKVAGVNNKYGAPFNFGFELTASQKLRLTTAAYVQRMTRLNRTPTLRAQSPWRPHRVTHCFLCKHPLDNAVDAECTTCGWIICMCGGCGCVYN